MKIEFKKGTHRSPVTGTLELYRGVDNNPFSNTSNITYLEHHEMSIRVSLRYKAPPEMYEHAKESGLMDMHRFLYGSLTTDLIALRRTLYEANCRVGVDAVSTILEGITTGKYLREEV